MIKNSAIIRLSSFAEWQAKLSESIFHMTVLLFSDLVETSAVAAVHVLRTAHRMLVRGGLSCLAALPQFVFVYKLRNNPDYFLSGNYDRTIFSSEPESNVPR